MNRNILFALIAISLFLSCSSRVPFTNELRRDYDLTPAELRNLQYYLKGEIILRHELIKGHKEITRGHTLKVESGKYIEEVKIRNRTPGICTLTNYKSLRISFEEGSGRSLSFGSGESNTEPYQLLACSTTIIIPVFL